jgi:two-component sensor histidine kinase
MQRLALCIFSYFLLFSFIPCAAQIIEPPLGNRSREGYIKMLTDSLAIAQKGKDTINIIRYTAVLTTQLQGISNAKAYSYLLLALRYAKAHDNPKWFADVCNRAGMLMLSYANDLPALKKLKRTSAQLYDSSMYWHRQAVRKGLAIGRHGTAGWGYRGLLNTAKSHYSKWVRDSITYYYNHAIAMAMLTHDSELEIYSSTTYGAYLRQQDERNKTKSVGEIIAFENSNRMDGIPVLMDKLMKAEAAEDTTNVISHAFNLTNSFRRALMMDQASNYIEIALSYAEAYSDTTLLAYAYLHKGALMADMANKNSARYYYLQTIKTGGKSNPVGWAYYHLLLEIIDGPMNHHTHDSILYYYNKALEIGDQLNNRNLKSSCAFANYRYLIKTGNLEKAGTLLKSLSLQQLKMDVTTKEAFYSSVHDYLARINHLDTLTILKKLATEQHDIVTAAKHQEQLYAKDQQYEVSKTKNILEATSNRLDTTNKVLMTSIAALIAFTVLITYLFLLFRKNKRLSQRNELLLKEQNHRVKNNLQMISSLLSLQSQKLLSTDAKDALQESTGRINSVALLHRMLYEGETVGNIEATAYIRSLTEEIQYSAGREMKIELNLPEKLELKIEKVTSLGLIINELLTNSIKHVDNSIELHVHLMITAHDEKLHLSYSDNGYGVTPEAWMSSPSFGNQLIQMQSRQLRGEFKVSTAGGFKYELMIAA